MLDTHIYSRVCSSDEMCTKDANFLLLNFAVFEGLLYSRHLNLPKQLCSVLSASLSRTGDVACATQSPETGTHKSNAAISDVIRRTCV